MVPVVRAAFRSFGSLQLAARKAPDREKHSLRLHATRNDETHSFDAMNSSCSTHP
jgi:hypothetical protein